MDTWRQVWRNGIAPLLSASGLEALRSAIVSDDVRLVQGATTEPPPLYSARDWHLEGACALGFCGWQGEGLETVGEVEEFVTRLCAEIDRRLGEPTASRWFMHWFDDTPRDLMRRQLLAEVSRTLARQENEKTEVGVTAA